MKNSSIPLVALAVCMGLAFSVAIFARFHSYKSSSLTACQSQLILLHGQFRLNADFSFAFGNTIGSVTVNGEGQDQGGAFTIDRRVDFTYELVNGEIFLNSMAVHPYTGDTAEKGGVKKHLPNFFFLGNTSLSLSLYKINNKPVFELSGTPLFLCK